MTTILSQATARGQQGRGETNDRNIKQLLLLALGLIAATLSAQASDPVGIYALVDKVVYEPNDKAPERVQIWGAFSLAEGRGDGYGHRPFVQQRRGCVGQPPVARVRPHHLCVRQTPHRFLPR